MNYRYHMCNYDVYGYYKITKNGISEREAEHYFEIFMVGNIYYDYGTKDEYFLKMLNEIGCLKSLYIIRLNDLGYLVSDVLNNLEMLNRKFTQVYISGKYIDTEVAYEYIKNHFALDRYVNFDKYHLPFIDSDFMG